MTGGRPERPRRRSTAALVFAGGLGLIAAMALLVNPAANWPTAQRAVANQSCQPTGSCSGPTASAHTSPTPTASRSASAASPSGQTSPTPPVIPTPTGTPATTPTSVPTGTPPPPPPPTSSSPPPASGYFGLRPVSSWSALPSDSQCVAQVHYSTWEPRPENYQQNHTRPAPGAMAASFSTRPRNLGGTYNPLWDSWLLHRVDGQFTGRTDEIFQWAACKWGLPDNVIRATAVEESTWFQYLHFPSDASYGGGGGGSCYWQYGCGDAFSSATPASTVYCNGIATQGHDYQRDPVTGTGGYPYTPTTGLCPKTFSILGVMSWDDPAWQAPYAAYAGNQNGTFPFTRDSTAAAADYFGAYIRGCYEGWTYWLKSTATGTYAAGDLWGCIGSWYSGDWHSSAANTYMARVQADQNTTIWLTPAFDDSRQQYQCDSKYGCPS